MKTFIANKYIKSGIFVLAGIVIGWLVFHRPAVIEKKDTELTEHKHSVWTCSMHPQIRRDASGQCPICAMDLIPLEQNTSAIDPNAIHITDDAIALANIQTTKVSRGKAIKDIRLYGKIQADERQIQTLASHIPGRIEKLFINFTGEIVTPGQPIASIYSPELINAQEELLQTLKLKASQPALVDAAREKLQQWKLTYEQIAEIERSGNIKPNFEIKALLTGIVTTKNVNVGDYVQQGSVLYEVANLSKVWAMFDAYESDLGWLNKGDAVSFALDAIPGKTYTGKVSFIDPVLNPNTRVAKVRIEVDNAKGLLKPEMFITGQVKANLKEHLNDIIIPQTSVLWTGKRSVVYIKIDSIAEPTFLMREIDLGPSLGNSYIVLSGLREGETIVTNGAFTIDAASQLAGKPSMMGIENDKSGIPHSNAIVSIVEETFQVFGNCEMCKDRIETAAKSVNDVISAIWDNKTKVLSVKYRSTEGSSHKIHKAIALSGHDTEKEKTSNEVYFKLPECCLYRK